MNLLFRLWTLLLVALVVIVVVVVVTVACCWVFAGAVVFMVLFCWVLWGLLLLLVLLLIDVGIVVVVILVSGFRDFSCCYSMWVHVVACFLYTIYIFVSCISSFSSLILSVIEIRGSNYRHWSSFLKILEPKYCSWWQRGGKTFNTTDRTDDL